MSEDDSDRAKRDLVERISVFVIGAVQDLRDAGILTGDIGARLPPAGISRYDQLKASGYRPNDREIEMILAAFGRASGETVPSDVVDCVKRFARDELP